MVTLHRHLNLRCMNPPYGTRYMTHQIIITNEPDDYYNVFQTDLFTRPTTGRPLNWLENGDRRLGKEQQEDNDETGEKDERND